MYLLLDIGGTTTKIASSQDGQKLDLTRSFPTEQEFEKALDLISQNCLELLGEKKVDAVVAGVAGTLDKDKTTLLSSPNLPKWTQQPLKQFLEENFNAPVYLENDAHLGGLGEASYGAGKNYQIVGFITIGTGVGGARIVDQKIDVNSFGFEVGHQIIEIDGNNCNCGGRGHLEAYIGGAYLKGLYKEGAESIKDEQIWQEISKYLSIGLTNTILHWSPDIVVLGGSISQRIPLEIVKGFVKENLTVFPPPDIVKSHLGSEAGLYGGLKIIKSLNLI